MAKQAGISVSGVTSRVEVLETEVEDLREMIRSIRCQRTEALQQTRAETKRAIGVVALRGLTTDLRG